MHNVSKYQQIIKMCLEIKSIFFLQIMHVALNFGDIIVYNNHIKIECAGNIHILCQIMLLFTLK